MAVAGFTVWQRMNASGIEHLIKTQLTVSNASNDVLTSLVINRQNSAGPGGNGIGGRLSWDIEDSTTTPPPQCQWDVVLDNAASPNVDSSTRFRQKDSGTMKEVMRVDGSFQGVLIHNDATRAPNARLDCDGSAIFNESGAAVDFRVESDNNANMLLVNGTLDEMNVGSSSISGFTLNILDDAQVLSSSGSALFAVQEALTGAFARLRCTTGSAIPGIEFGTTVTITSRIRRNASGDLEINPRVSGSGITDVLFPSRFNDYVDYPSLATPANPPAGTRRLFTDSGTGELSVRTSGGATVSLESGGGGGGGLTYRQVLSVVWMGA